MTIERAAARLRKKRMTREQPPQEAVIPPRGTRFAIYRVTTDVRTGEETRRSLVDTKRVFEVAQGAALARNISEESDDIFVVVREEV